VDHLLDLGGLRELLAIHLDVVAELDHGFERHTRTPFYTLGLLAVSSAALSRGAGRSKSDRLGLAAFVR
jgi:hypothetical protein